MSFIEDFASMSNPEILELAQVRAYQRRINGKMTNVKQAQRGGAAKADSSKQEEPPSVDVVLAKRVPVKDLTDVQRYLIKQRSKAYKDIVDRHKKLRGAVTDEYSEARDVLAATATYYDALADKTSDYDSREALRIEMESRRLKLRNTIREKLRLQAAVTPQQNGELPPVW